MKFLLCCMPAASKPSPIRIFKKLYLEECGQELPLGAIQEEPMRSGGILWCHPMHTCWKEFPQNTWGLPRSKACKECGVRLVSLRRLHLISSRCCEMAKAPACLALLSGLQSGEWVQSWHVSMCESEKFREAVSSVSPSFCRPLKSEILGSRGERCFGVEGEATAVGGENFHQHNLILATI